MRKSDVIDAFLSHRACHARTLWTDGNSIASYHTVIARWNEREFNEVEFTFPRISATTAGHIQLVAAVAQRRGITVVDCNCGT